MPLRTKILILNVIFCFVGAMTVGAQTPAVASKPLSEAEFVKKYSGEPFKAPITLSDISNNHETPATLDRAKLAFATKALTLLQFKRGGDSSCSGVFIGPRLAITASDCLTRLNSKDLPVEPRLPRLPGDVLTIAPDIQVIVVADFAPGAVALVYVPSNKYNQQPYPYTPVDFTSLTFSKDKPMPVYGLGYAVEARADINPWKLQPLIRFAMLNGFNDEPDYRCMASLDCSVYCCRGDLGGGVFDWSGKLRGVLTYASKSSTPGQFASGFDIANQTIGLEALVASVNADKLNPTKQKQSELLALEMARLAALPAAVHPRDKELSWILRLSRGQQQAYLRIGARAVENKKAEGQKISEGQLALLGLRLLEDFAMLHATGNEEASLQAWRDTFGLYMQFLKQSPDKELANDFLLSLSIKYPLLLLTQLLPAVGADFSGMQEELVNEAGSFGVPLEDETVPNDFGLSDFQVAIAESVGDDSLASTIKDEKDFSDAGKFLELMKTTLNNDGFKLNDDWETNLYDPRVTAK